jgi:hypothetical protein
MAQISQYTGSEPQPIRGDRGASILGPRNVPLERENPDLLASPYTDSGTIPNLKFSFAAARWRDRAAAAEHPGSRDPFPALLPSAPLPWSCLPSVSPRPALSLRRVMVSRVCRPQRPRVRWSGVYRSSIGVSAIRSPSRHRRERRTCTAVLRCPRRPAERSQPSRRLRGLACRT